MRMSCDRVTVFLILSTLSVLLYYISYHLVVDIQIVRIHDKSHLSDPLGPLHAQKNNSEIIRDNSVKNKNSAKPLETSKHREKQEKLGLVCKTPANANYSDLLLTPPIDLKPDYYIKETKDCDNFRSTRGYYSTPGTEAELNFPLAYSIIMYSEVDRAERLLRAIYQPQNFYCVHVDKKAEEEVTSAMTGIGNCFKNVFVLPDPVSVKWGQFSVLEAELKCMKVLAKYSWKYFINLTGQEFPLKTNWELVKIFTAYGGANDVDGTSKV